MAGYLLLSFDYFPAFGLIATLLLASAPVFLWQVGTTAASGGTAGT